MYTANRTEIALALLITRSTPDHFSFVVEQNIYELGSSPFTIVEANANANNAQSDNPTCD